MNNLPIFVSPDRDSLSSNPDSMRSGSFFQKSFNTRTYEKKITLDRRVFNKLMNFFKSVVKELGVGMNEIAMIEEYVQTEEIKESYNGIHDEVRLTLPLNTEDILALTDEDSNSSHSNTNRRIKELSENNESLKKLCENYKKENLEMKHNNDALVSRIEELTTLSTNLLMEKEEFVGEIEKLKADLESAKGGSATNSSKENSDENCTEYIEKEEVLYNIPKVFESEKIINMISDFLLPKDFFSFYNSSKFLQIMLNKSNFQVKNLKLAIEFKNTEILNYKFYDWCKEYEVNDIEIERLIREYVQYNRLAGSDLKNMLTKALGYIDRDVKSALGMTNNFDNSEKKSRSLFGSLNNYFNKIIKKKEDPSNSVKRNSVLLSGNMYENINDYDKHLVTDNLVNNELNVEFDFNSADDIKGLLVQFFTSLRNNPNTISNFISELITEYSEFIFYAQRTLIEIKELDIVKHAMHERFKKYHKIAFEQENEIEDLKKFSKTNKEIKDILLKQKQEIEVKYTDCITQIIYYKDELNKTSNKLMTITEKYNRIENEFETFKSKLVKEFKMLKNEYDHVSNERAIILGAILEFKKYFLRFHITEDGDLAYIDVE